MGFQSVDETYHCTHFRSMVGKHLQHKMPFTGHLFYKVQEAIKHQVKCIDSLASHSLLKAVALPTLWLAKYRHRHSKRTKELE